jgi:hypothetical protein
MIRLHGRLLWEHALPEVVDGAEHLAAQAGASQSHEKQLCYT